jgi:hypothetical protein
MHNSFKNKMAGDREGVNENRYTMTFGGGYGFKDGAESMIHSAHVETIMLSAGGAESIILSGGSY